MQEYKYIVNAINYIKAKSIKYPKMYFYLGFKKYHDQVVTFQVSNKKTDIQDVKYYFLNGKMDKYLT